MSKEVKGYKVFNSDWTCKGKQYAVGKRYKHKGKLSICKTRLHFCLKLSDCYSYYSFDKSNKIAEVIGRGKVTGHDDDSKKVTNDLEIVREVSWKEAQGLVNEGTGNTGVGNTGDSNTGDSNTGDSNTGDRNTGNWNTGDSNTGDRNTGNWNTGDRNTGYRNTGDSNTGDSNTGDSNTGDSNTSDRNTGDWNTGDRNTGDWNTGDWNTGDWNSGSRSTGTFNTHEEKIMMFNKPSDWTYFDWCNSDACRILGRVKITEWESNKKHAAEGYTKAIPFKTACRKLWKSLSAAEKKTVMSLPNFDKKIFHEITGIKC